jgi:hypothetical protein
VLIQIERAVRLTLLDSEVQTLKAGEIYEVAPAIGRVLVGDGWASEVAAERREPLDQVDAANDDPCDEMSGS